jgi:hypothetical protein
MAEIRPASKVEARFSKSNQYEVKVFRADASGLEMIRDP